MPTMDAQHMKLPSMLRQWPLYVLLEGAQRQQTGREGNGLWRQVGMKRCKLMRALHKLPGAGHGYPVPRSHSARGGQR